ncbi:hypothetical protein JEZ13_10615 [bacterium]|nr:hypothetical protein [bacterium]
MVWSGSTLASTTKLFQLGAARGGRGPTEEVYISYLQKFPSSEFISTTQQLNNSTTQQLNNSTTQQLNNSTTQQLNNKNPTSTVTKA